MKTYIIKIDCTRESEVKEYRFFADTSFEAVLYAGIVAGRESDGVFDTINLVSVEEIVEERRLVWLA